MKVRLSDVYVSVPVLNKVLDLELPINVSYKVMKLVNSLNTELKNIEEQRVKLVKKYSGSDQNNVSEENKQEFLKEFSALLEEEIDVSWDKISVSSLGTNMKLSVNDLGKISYLFSE